MQLTNLKLIAAVINVAASILAIGGLTCWIYAVMSNKFPAVSWTTFVKSEHKRDIGIGQLETKINFHGHPYYEFTPELETSAEVLKALLFQPISEFYRNECPALMDDSLIKDFTYNDELVWMPPATLDISFDTGSSAVLVGLDESDERAKYVGPKPAGSPPKLVASILSTGVMGGSNSPNLSRRSSEEVPHDTTISVSPQRFTKNENQHHADALNPKEIHRLPGSSHTGANINIAKARRQLQEAESPRHSDKSTSNRNEPQEGLHADPQGVPSGSTADVEETDEVSVDGIEQDDEDADFTKKPSIQKIEPEREPDVERGVNSPENELTVAYAVSGENPGSNTGQPVVSTSSAEKAQSLPDDGPVLHKPEAIEGPNNVEERSEEPLEDQSSSEYEEQPPANLIADEKPIASSDDRAQSTAEGNTNDVPQTSRKSHKPRPGQGLNQSAYPAERIDDAELEPLLTPPDSIQAMSGQLIGESYNMNPYDAPTFQDNRPPKSDALNKYVCEAYTKIWAGSTKTRAYTYVAIAGVVVHAVVYWGALLTSSYKVTKLLVSSLCGVTGLIFLAFAHKNAISTLHLVKFGDVINFFPTEMAVTTMASPTHHHLGSTSVVWTLISIHCIAICSELIANAIELLYDARRPAPNPNPEDVDFLLDNAPEEP